MAVSVVIWHNPRCSKSRATLALLTERGIDPEVRLYLEDVPTEAELRAALELLGIGAGDLVRKAEAAYREEGLSAASRDKDILAAMVRAPKLIERPVVFANGKAALGRPPGAVLRIL